MNICITESLCYTPETNTTLKISYIPVKLKCFFLKKVVVSFKLKQQFDWMYLYLLGTL